MGLSEFFKRFFKKIATPMGVLPVDVETLRERFKFRYLHFKLLLTANNKALELMADLEMALQGNRTLDMGFIRTRTTRIAVNVFQIIRHLDQIAPGKYAALFEQYEIIKEQLHRLLNPVVAPTERPLVKRLCEVGMVNAGEVGRKMASIGEVGRFAGIAVPKGFVVTTEGYHRFMASGGLREEIGRIVQSSDAHRTGELLALSRQIEACILSSPLPEALSDAILAAFDEISAEMPDSEMAFRSSAIGEDEPCLSFAGMYCSCLHIKREQALWAYKRVVAGTFSPQAVSYRWTMGIRDIDVAMAVGVMPMVAAVKGGVAYSRNPLNRKEPTVIVESAPGLPTTVVNGSGTDRVAASREAPFQVVRREGALPETDDDVITDAEASRIAEQALRIEAHLKVPQDIEWAMEPDGRVIILQCRPLAGPSDRDENEVELSEPSINAPVVATGGVAVSSGTAAGNVFIARSESDVGTCPDDAVLVLSQPLPIFATLIHRIQAVVSERGGIAGHLASVCRQFEVPSLFGIDAAAELMADQATVTVDADRKRIYSGRVPGVTNRPNVPTEPYQRSGVFRALQEVTARIIPLNMMDPDASEFKPASCETFHDITRFCHEKAVREMFEFGVKEPFPGHASKQLIVDQPMQFWLIDLDDGFNLSDPDSPYVKLEEIASIPMLALWRGMTAVPWKGPPPVNPSGFLEILFGSTSDPSLVPSMPSGYFAKNYFMVSKHFMSLQSRFGYHYSTVETLVSSRAIENYASFNFKGGAAGLERRTRRAKMIAEVLEEEGFRVKRFGDGVRARIEGFERSFMISRVAMLGYLLMHTRQLDMDMSDEASVKKHKSVILEELTALSDIQTVR